MVFTSFRGLVEAGKSYGMAGRYLSEMHHGYGRASSYDGNGSACVNRNNDCIRNFPGKLFVCCFWQYLGFGSLIGFPSMSQRSLYSLEMDLVYRC